MKRRLDPFQIQKGETVHRILISKHLSHRPSVTLPLTTAHGSQIWTPRSLPKRLIDNREYWSLQANPIRPCLDPSSPVFVQRRNLQRTLNPQSGPQDSGQNRPPNKEYYTQACLRWKQISRTWSLLKKLWRLASHAAGRSSTKSISRFLCDSRSLSLATSFQVSTYIVRRCLESDGSKIQKQGNAMAFLIIKEITRQPHTYLEIFIVLSRMEQPV